MRNLKLTLAYDGAEYFGWQLQPDVPTVMGTLLETLRKITGEKTWLHGASRTDGGVHALGQVANFKTRSSIPTDGLQRALNALLPPSIRVLGIEEVSLDFHSRWHARGKRYRYRILRSEICPPFEHAHVYHYPYPLDEEAMRRAAPFFEGEHDFSTFGTWDAEDKDKSKVRTVFSSRLDRVPEKQELVYQIHGRAFLRYMVRKIVGTLIDVGKGRLQPDDIPRLFDARDRSLAGPTAPPEGLYLVEVEYAAPDDASEVAAAQAAQADADSV